MNLARRSLLKATAYLAAAGPLARSQATDTGAASAGILPKNLPSMVEADGKLRLDFGDERMVLDRGLQPSLLRTASGALVVQAQMPKKPVETGRMHYPFALATVISRDDGQTWQDIPLLPNENGINLEAGALQLRDGLIVALDTYVTPGKNPDEGIGQLYTSNDDWRTLQGPQDAIFELPGIDFYASSDDGGRPHVAERLHRRILELPDGSLLTTIYGTMKGDRTPSAYKPTMMKMRVMLARSSDRGKHWKLVSTVAVNPAAGTEGFDEPVIARVSRGPRAGRLICFMRTGRELYETISGDQGKTWTPARPRTFGGLDINRTELWVDMFRKVKGRSGKLLDEDNLDELKGSVVDPDLIELRSGLLVAAFGMRIPQQLCWPNYQHPWNGNYLAFSHDHGDNWSNVVRLTSGVPTTHYMAIEETLRDNEIFVVYDYGFWNYPKRFVYARTVQATMKKGTS
jgi:hypothetical protein